MTDAPPGLNLIQRAMQFDATGSVDHLHAGFSEGRQAEPVSKYLPPHAGLDPRRFAGDSAPIELERIAPSQIEFNPGRCRDEKILLPGNPEIEARNEFRTIKRRLLLALRENPPEVDYPPVVLITSARPEEGKTFTALNLALTLADERDLHILLIEGDVVSPSLSKYFSTGRTREGLTDLLNENIQSATDVVHQCAEIQNLSVMFAGNPDPRASELMASPRMPEILGQLHRVYRNLVVVVDCSPVISPEPAALAGHATHTILVVAAEQSSRLELRDALDHVAACPRISLVFNKSPRWRKKGSYYQYGSRYGVAGGANQNIADLDAGTN
jgi:protein-tyrosine kinase